MGGRGNCFFFVWKKKTSRARLDINWRIRFSPIFFFLIKKQKMKNKNLWTSCTHATSTTYTHNQKRQKQNKGKGAIGGKINLNWRIWFSPIFILILIFENKMNYNLLTPTHTHTHQEQTIKYKNNKESKREKQIYSKWHQNMLYNFCFKSSEEINVIRFSKNEKKSFLKSRDSYAPVWRISGADIGRNKCPWTILGEE